MNKKSALLLILFLAVYSDTVLSGKCLQCATVKRLMADFWDLSPTSPSLMIDIGKLRTAEHAEREKLKTQLHDLGVRLAAAERARDIATAGQTTATQLAAERDTERAALKDQLAKHLATHATESGADKTEISRLQAMVQALTKERDQGRQDLLAMIGERDQGRKNILALTTERDGAIGLQKTAEALSQQREDARLQLEAQLRKVEAAQQQMEADLRQQITDAVAKIAMLQADLGTKTTAYDLLEQKLLENQRAQAQLKEEHLQLEAQLRKVEAAQQQMEADLRQQLTDSVAKTAMLQADLDTKTTAYDLLEQKLLENQRAQAQLKEEQQKALASAKALHQADLAAALSKLRAQLTQEQAAVEAEIAGYQRQILDFEEAFRQKDDILEPLFELPRSESTRRSRLVSVDTEWRESAAGQRFLQDYNELEARNYALQRTEQTQATELLQAQAELSRQQESIALAQEFVSGLKKQLQKEKAFLAHSKIENAALLRDLKTSGVEKMAIADELKRTNAVLSRDERHIGEFEEKISELQAGILDQRNQLLILAKERDVLNQAQARANTELLDAEALLRDYDADNSDLVQRVVRAEQYAHTLTGRQEALEQEKAALEAVVTSLRQKFQAFPEEAGAALEKSLHSLPGRRGRDAPAEAGPDFQSTLPGKAHPGGNGRCLGRSPEPTGEFFRDP